MYSAAIIVEAMPSRKRAKGQARKAAKVKNVASEKARKDEALFRVLEQSQIQRLQNSNAQSSVPFMQGFDPFSDDHVCIKFIRAFVTQAIMNRLFSVLPLCIIVNFIK